MMEERLKIASKPSKARREGWNRVSLTVLRRNNFADTLILDSCLQNYETINDNKFLLFMPCSL